MTLVGREFTRRILPLFGFLKIWGLDFGEDGYANKKCQSLL